MTSNRGLTHDDYKLFFEALGEYGKDFQNIQQYMSQKGSKGTNKSSTVSTTTASTSATTTASTSVTTLATNSSTTSLSTTTTATTTTTFPPSSTSDQNISNNNNHNKSCYPYATNSSSLSIEQQQDKKDEDKKREQIRNFYNKLYAKLSQLIGKLDDRVEKVNQELYLLINYGEIWKKHGSKFNNKPNVNNKTKKLLEELVHHGSTTLRFKNKNVRLRTPPCKALKKINEIGVDEKVKVVSARELPKDVVVEFHPASNKDWLKVQSISQNPRVRAKLSIQKRLFSVLDFLENKWDISQEKMNKTVDALLKVTPTTNNFVQNSIEDLQQQQQQQQQYQTNACPTGNNTTHQIPDNTNNLQSGNNGQTTNQPDQQQTMTNSEIHLRLRLKPSAIHELKEVNITRVVPDNHLDLSLTAYIKRLGGSISKNVSSESTTVTQSSSTSSKTIVNNNYSNINREANATLQQSFINQLQSHLHSNNNNNPSDGNMIIGENHIEVSQGGSMSNTGCRLPVSLTTPDCSILFERSLTSDQPSIASQARRQLNLLSTLAGSFGGCENSRTACDDTQDRSMTAFPINSETSRGFGGRSVTFAGVDSNKPSTMMSNNMLPVNNNIPALFDEDASLVPTISIGNEGNNNSNMELALTTTTNVILSQQNSDSQRNRSDDFNIPNNLTLGDYFKMADGQNGVGGSGDDANHAFSTSTQEKLDPIEESAENKLDNEFVSTEEQLVEGREESAISKSKNNSGSIQLYNHMIEIEKFAEGWTRHEESAITIGELYLAFKCPEKIVLEYSFEQYIYTKNHQQLTPNSVEKQQVDNLNHNITVIPDPTPNDSMIFKLLTAASLSLAHLEQQKQEQQNKLLQQEQPTSKAKRRKGNPNNTNTITKNLTSHDIERTNQRVVEALKQLQPTKLRVYRRAR